MVALAFWCFVDGPYEKRNGILLRCTTCMYNYVYACAYDIEKICVDVFLQLTQYEFINSYHPAMLSLCLGAYGSVFVCVECYSCSRINEVQVRVSIGF